MKTPEDPMDEQHQSGQNGSTLAEMPTPSIAGAVPATCNNCGSVVAPGGTRATPTFVFAIGRVEARFPLLAVEKEFAQVSGRSADTAGLTDAQVLQKVLSREENRYLIRHVCWVMRIEGLETYILVPRDAADADRLLGTLRDRPSPVDMDVVIGVRGPLAPAEMCNGLVVPIVVFDHIYSFDRDALIKDIPRGDKAAKGFEATASELLDRIMQLADNAGATNEHRALNYLAVRYPAIYASAASAHERNASLSAVEVRRSPLSGTREIVEVIFSYTNRSTDVVEKVFCRVDVTEEFPFLVTKLSPYFDR
jgi:PatG C-terminal